MPVFNAEETISEAIESILVQSLESFDFIIVDDGSADNSFPIIRSYADSDSRIRMYQISHSGIVEALNFGVDKATASYIARMDADDISLPQRLQKQTSYLDQHPKTGVVSCLVQSFGSTERGGKGYKRHIDWLNSLTDPDTIKINRFIESPVAHPSVMFRRELIQKYGGYKKGQFPEDYELWLRWLERGVLIDKIPELLLKWRDEDNRLSRTDTRYSFEAFYRIKAEYLARWLQLHNPHHPDIIVWGAGRTSRKRADMLVDYGINITHYIDIDPNKIGHTVHGRPVLDPMEIPPPEDCFIVSYVARWNANRWIQEHLEKHGFTIGINALFAA